MSFSFRNLFSQEAPGDSTDTRPLRPGAAGEWGAIPTETNWPGGNGGFAGPGSGDGGGFRPNPQPTDRGDFTALFGKMDAPEGARGERGLERVFRIGEILPLIPPALVSRGNLGPDEQIRIWMPANGSRDVKLSQIYEACPRLFATAITALNDSLIALPLPPAPQEALPGGAMAGGGDSLMPARKTGGLPGPRSGDNGRQGAGENPFWMQTGDLGWASRPAAGAAADGRVSPQAAETAGRATETDAASFPGSGFGGFSSGQSGTPGAFFDAAPEPAPGAEHFGHPSPGFVPRGGFGFPEGAAHSGAANPFRGESFRGGSNQPEAADWGFGAMGEAGRRPQDVSPAYPPSPTGGSGAFGFPGFGEAVQPMTFEFGSNPDTPAEPPAPCARPQSPQGGHGMPDAVAFPTSGGGPGAQSQEAVSNPFTGGFDTLFSQGAKSDATPPQGFGARDAERGEPVFSANPFLQSAEPRSVSFLPPSFSAEIDHGANPFAEQGAGDSSGMAPPERGQDFSAFLPPRAAVTPPMAAMPERRQEPGGRQGEAQFSRAQGSFLEELERQPEGHAWAPEPPEGELRSTRAARAPSSEHPAVRDIELRAVFGTREAFTLQRVADLTIELSGVASCFISSSRGSAQSPQRETRNRQEQADSILRGVRELARITGVESAETFTMHTDHGVVSVFMHGDACLTVRHERGDFEPGMREKLILVARGVSQLSG